MPSQVKIIPADEARDLLDKNPDILLLDVRQPEEYKKAHIPGAVLLPLPDLPDRLAGLEASKGIITYCRIGRRSLAAAQLIADETDSEIYTIDGGIMAWNGLVATGDVERCMIITKDLKNSDEFISLAYTLEDGAERFYLMLSEILTDAKAVELFKKLSEVERNHKKSISDKRQGITIDQRFADHLESCMRISDAIDEVTKHTDIRNIIEYSMQLETNSLDIYMKILREIKDVDNLFRDIIQEEKAHLGRLGELLSGYET